MEAEVRIEDDLSDKTQSLSIAQPHTSQVLPTSSLDPMPQISAPFPLLSLPTELRERIYLHLLIPSPLHTLPLTGPHTLYPLALLLTCHQLYSEVRFLYFRHNIFRLHLTRHTTVPSLPIFRPSFRDYLLQIPHLRLIISRWGKGAFFTQTFLPVLEQCILHGRLKVLEVRIEDVKIGGVGRIRGTEASLGLKRVLEDPYLDVATVQTGDGMGKLVDVTWRLDRSGWEGVVRSWDARGKYRFDDGLA
jgi:hypothetical protein